MKEGGQMYMYPINFVAISITCFLFISSCDNPEKESGFCALEPFELERLQAIIDHPGWNQSPPPTLDEVLHSSGIIFGDGCSARIENGGIRIEGGKDFVAQIEQKICSDFLRYENWMLEYLSETEW